MFWQEREGGSTTLYNYPMKLLINIGWEKCFKINNSKTSEMVTILNTLTLKGNWCVYPCKLLVSDVFMYDICKVSHFNAEKRIQIPIIIYLLLVNQGCTFLKHKHWNTITIIFLFSAILESTVWTLFDITNDPLSIRGFS